MVLSVSSIEVEREGDPVFLAVGAIVLSLSSTWVDVEGEPPARMIVL